MRLLIAEDDIQLLKPLKYIFEKNKYIVDAVSNGTEALDYASTGEYDGIVPVSYTHLDVYKRQV